MAAVKALGLSSTSATSCRGRFVAVLHAPKLGKYQLSLPKLPIIGNVEQLNTQARNPIQIKIEKQRKSAEWEGEHSSTVEKLYAIMEAVADRAVMHESISEQRNNWNNLLVNSINAITLTAATMAGLSTVPVIGNTPVLALKVSSVLLYSAATGLLLLVNKIQPSQLAEEQRNAARLFRELHTQIQTTLAIRTPTQKDAKDAMDKVLALDRAYPLPLLPGMLEKFPAIVEPARWWPSHNAATSPHSQMLPSQDQTNGWNGNLEEEMRDIVAVLKRKDTAEYVKLSKLVLKINRILAFSGPLLTGLASLGTSFAGSSTSFGSLAAVVGVAGGALASVVNTFEHGGQVGMVFEMYRNCGGFYRLLEESIESNLKEREPSKRENGEVFEMKVALHLGRSLSDLRNLAASSTKTVEGATEQFASKLF
ncbi:hypothetical protein ACLOJK_039368 [Asimina triloba]